MAYSQPETSKADSLLNALKGSSDTEKISILIKLAKEFSESDESYNYAKQAYDIAVKLNSKPLQAEVLFVIGRCYYQNYQESLALNYFFESLKLYEELNEGKNVAKTLCSISRCYFYIDSLNLANQYSLKAFNLSKSISDYTGQSEALLNLADILDYEFKHDEALRNIFQALDIMEKNGSPEDISKVYNSLGKQYFNLGEYKKSIEYYRKEIEIQESIKEYRGLMISHHNLGRTHRTIGNYQLALEQYQNSLRYSEQLNDKLIIAANSSEIGLVYENLSRSMLSIDENEQNYKRALSFHEIALTIYREKQIEEKIGESLNNIANNYSHLAANKFVSQYGEYWEDSLFQISSQAITASFSKTFEYYNQALEIFEKKEKTKEIINLNINLGTHYIYTRDWNKVKQHLNKALRLAKQTNSQSDIALAEYMLGDYYLRIRDFESAEQNFQQSLQVSTSLGIKDLMRWTHQKLAKLYELTGNPIKALRHEKMTNRIKDELFSEQSQKVITEMQTKYETEKKEQEIKLLNNERALQQSVIQKQRLTLAITIGGLLIILAFAGLLINMVRQKQRANRILEEKNELISHQKQEITDSIRYASRIQNAILPSSSILSDALNEHFVLFLPRDIVSGDFYWFTKQQNKIVLVAADCTGHGVPGAFMSMLGVSFLYEIVSKEGIVQPSHILDMLRDLVKVTLSQTGKKDEQKDGMDISLCTIDLENMKMEWAGAYNPLFLIRNNELIEYKADKMPVAIHLTDHKPFTNNYIDLMPDDVFYMFSDGFADQFGGVDSRKFMIKQFKNLLLDIHQKPMDEQKEKLHQAHLNWRGNLEQIDDIVVFGVRI
jgi:serine phosphatase RsbU (regulator of sigma subunit)/Tfp pilus assembly protein PilF